MSPMRRERYPADWDEISLRIRERAGQKCEQCGVPNHALIYRPPENPDAWVVVPDPISQDDLYRIFGGRPISELSRVVKIVLTVAHLDHDPSNNDENNGDYPLASSTRDRMEWGTTLCEYSLDNFCDLDKSVLETSENLSNVLIWRLS